MWVAAMTICALVFLLMGWCLRRLVEEDNAGDRYLVGYSDGRRDEARDRYVPDEAIDAAYDTFIRSPASPWMAMGEAIEAAIWTRAQS